MEKNGRGQKDIKENVHEHKARRREEGTEKDKKKRSFKFFTF